MPVSPEQIISEISFGFWHQMVSKSQLFLWPDLAGAFPNSPNRGQKTVQEPVARLRDFRNRIGHHHRIWSIDLAARYDDLLTVTRYLDVDFASWIDDRSRVVDLLAQRPYTGENSRKLTGVQDSAARSGTSNRGHTRFA